jgi:DNA mismatch repair protein MutS2
MKINIEKSKTEIEKSIANIEKYLSESNVIQNDSFEFDEEQLKPTFVFKEGLPGNSYAFFLAKNVGLDANVLKNAKKYLGGRQKQLEKSIITLQKHKKEYENLVLENRRELLNTEKIKEDYETKKKEFNAKKNKIIDDAKLEAAQILTKASALVDTTIKELKETKKSEINIKKEFKEAKENISKEAENIRRKQVIKKMDLEIVDMLEVDDVVGMIGNSGTGIVLEADNTEKIALISINGLKFRLPYSQLHLKEKIVQTPKTNVTPLNLNVQTKLDLRGYRAEEALQTIDKFISDAIHGNLNSISIIHGHGTGVLREITHNFLKTIPEIKSFRLGGQFEGGGGATIVYFR